MKRQAATPCGLQRRLHDLKLHQIADPRDQRLIDHPLPALIGSTVVAMVTDAPGLRGVETRTEQIASKQPGWLGIRQRIADNTVGALLRRLDPALVAECLHRLNKAEARRGNLRPTRMGVAAAAIDGKNTATLPWHELCHLAKLDEDVATPDRVREVLRRKYPQVQVCVPNRGNPYGLIRCHTVTSVSSDAACCLHVCNIPGATNEIGALPETLRQLYQAYGNTKIIEVVTTDAGNSSRDAGIQIVDTCKWDYFAQIKREHGLIYDTTLSRLGKLGTSEAALTQTETREGHTVTYHVWRHTLPQPGFFSWPHVRQRIRIRREVVDSKTREVLSIGDRYYLCSRSDESISELDCMKLARIHWRCENEVHWTADAVCEEDKRRLKWSRHPVGIIVAAILRQIAIAILALARSLSRSSTHSGKPTWREVIEHFILTLCESTLRTEAFDTCLA